MLDSDPLLSYMEDFSMFEAGDFVKWMEPLIMSIAMVKSSELSVTGLL